jgi:hypothetical protein
MKILNRIVHLLVILTLLIGVGSAQQLVMDVSAKELLVEETAKIKISLNLHESAKLIVIKINVDKNILENNEIKGDGVFNNINISQMVQFEDHIIINKKIDGKKGTIYLPLKSKEDGLRTVSLTESYFLKKDNLERINLTSNPTQINIYWKNKPEIIPTIPAISFNLPPENKPADPYVLKYVDKIQIYKDEPLNVFYLVYCPYSEKINLNFDETLTFGTYFKFFDNSINKEVKFSYNIIGGGYVSIHRQTITCDKAGKVLLLPAQVTFNNASGLNRTILSEPSFIEIEVKNKPPEIKNIILKKMESSSYFDKVWDLLDDNITYEAIIYCEDMDGKIRDLELSSDLDGDLYNNSCNNSTLSCIVPFRLNNKGNHKIKLCVKDDNDDWTVKEYPINSEESQFIKFLQIFITGSILIAFIQLVINWERMCIWLSNRFYVVNKLIIKRLRTNLRYYVNWRYIRAKYTYSVLTLEILTIVLIVIIVTLYILYLI